jgi:hypothetical protein
MMMMMMMDTGCGQDRWTVGRVHFPHLKRVGILDGALEVSHATYSHDHWRPER